MVYFFRSHDKSLASIISSSLNVIFFSVMTNVQIVVKSMLALIFPFFSKSTSWAAVNSASFSAFSPKHLQLKTWVWSRTSSALSVRVSLLLEPDFSVSWSSEELVGNVAFISITSVPFLENLRTHSTLQDQKREMKWVLGLREICHVITFVDAPQFRLYCKQPTLPRA